MEEHNKTADLVLEFALRLAANRSWSNLVYETPPYIYSGIFSSRETRKATDMRQMRADAKLLFDLESISHASPSARTLLGIIEDVFCPAVRVLLLAFERDHFRSSSRAGRSVLATMIITLPDSRCVEETHQHLRDLQRHSRSLVSAKITRARACVFSGVLEGRGINHE